jgi:ubiquitin-like modifier-activating enzyme ATG7
VGLVPHQIRGFVATYSNMLIVGHAYDRCTACSPHVLAGFKERGFQFVVEACGNATFLEDLTGLTAMKNEQVEWDISPVSDEETAREGGDDFSMD